MGDIHNQLLELASRKNFQVFEEFLDRDRFDDILHFFRDAPLTLLPEFDSYHGCQIRALRTNPEQWLAIAEIVFARGVIPYSLRHANFKLSDQQQQKIGTMVNRFFHALIQQGELDLPHFKAICTFLQSFIRDYDAEGYNSELRAFVRDLPEQFLEYQRQHECLGKDDAIAVLQLDQIITRRETLSPQRAYQKILWRLAIMEEGELSTEDSERRDINDWSHLTNALNDADLLALRGKGNSAFEHQLVWSWGSRHPVKDKGYSGKHWHLWQQYYKQYPERFIQFGPWDFRLLYQCWQSATPDIKELMAGRYLCGFGLCSDEDKTEEMSAMLEEMLRDQPVTDQLIKFSIDKPIALQVLQQYDRSGWLEKALLPIVNKLTVLAERAPDDERYPHYRQPLNELINQVPHQLKGITVEQTIGLLPLIDRQTFFHLLPACRPVCTKSSSQPLLAAWINVADQVPAAAIKQHWLSKPGKNLRQIIIEVLIRQSSPEAMGLLQALLNDPKTKLSLVETSRIEEALASSSIQTDNTRPQTASKSLAELEAAVAHEKRFSEPVTTLATEQLLQQMKPLSAHAAKALLQIVYDAGNRPMPQLAQQLLSQLSNTDQLALAQWLLQHWISNDGNKHLRWPLKLLEIANSNSLVDQLVDAVKRWHKEQRFQANQAIEYLANLNSQYAYMQILAIAETRSIRGSVRDQAWQRLQDIAQQRNLSVESLKDQLIPDFGLADGIDITVGDQTFHILLQGDLSLKVKSATGKLTQSPPKPRNTDFLPDWEHAKDQLKILNKNIKAVLKRQQPAMESAFAIGKQWPADQWQTLFLHNPLLRIMAQSLIWSDEQGRSFRISEDFSLVTVHDKAFALDNASFISLWHPVNATPEQQQEWLDYFADYEITPMIQQLGASRSLPTISEGKPAHQLTFPTNTRIDRSDFLKLMKKLGYRSGEGQAGGRIYDHYWTLAPDGYEMILQHGEMAPYDDDGWIVLEHLEITQGAAKVAVQSLPKALQATLQSHINTLLAAARTPA
jgi:hypothetical protein